MFICYTGMIIMKIVIVFGHVSFDPPLVIVDVNKLFTVRNKYYNTYYFDNIFFLHQYQRRSQNMIFSVLNVK